MTQRISRPRFAGLALAAAISFPIAGGAAWAQDWRNLGKIGGEILRRNAQPNNDAQASQAVALSPQEQAIRDDRVARERVRSAAIEGCLVTGAATAGLGAIIANNTGDKNIEVKEVAAAGLAGCAAGAMVGAARGKYINAKAGDYASVEQEERELIAALDEDLAYFAALNGKVANLIVAEREKVQRLNAQYSAGQIRANEYRTQIASMDENIKLVRESIDDITENIREVNADIATLKANNRPVAAFEERVAALRAEREQLLAYQQEQENGYASVPREVQQG